jgi:alkanesulfonate monooxygenase SsuD/methylene tetrahydromethanopterin reductase-like flavin-dependent oxidoreductase (luciferase family)
VDDGAVNPGRDQDLAAGALAYEPTVKEASRWILGSPSRVSSARKGRGRSYGNIEKRRGYDYSKHGQSDNPYLDFITDDIVDGFAVLGEPQDHIAKLKTLENAGITQFNIYLDNGNEEKIIADYGNTIIPAMT